jgi:signal transduction histidine kinase
MPQHADWVVARSWARPAGLTGLSAALAVAVVVAALVEPGSEEWSPGLLLSTAAIGVVGGLLAGLRPRYVGGWLLLVVGVAFLVGQWCEIQAFAVAEDASGVPVTAWVANWIYRPMLVVFFVLVPLTFPDGQVPTRRWRPVAVLAVGVAAALVLVGAFVEPTLRLGPNRSFPNPYAVPAPDWLDRAGEVLGLVTVVLALAAVASQVLRYRRAANQVREQILWVTLALAVLGAALALDASLAVLAPSVYPAVFPLIQLAPVVLPVAVAIAVLRHRLFDIKVVIGRVLVYGVLSIVLLTVYVLIALGLARAVPATTDLGRLLAAAVVALAFAPLRRRVQGMVGRRLFGDRSQPYAALVRVSREVAGSSSTSERVLTAMAASTAAALRSPWVGVELSSDEGVVAIGEAGRRPTGVDPTAVDLTALDLTGVDVMTRDLTHAGERVGRLRVAARAQDAFTAADQRLLADLALPIGAALHAVRLSIQLRASRERLIASVEDERRRTGRDLHDSLGPRLAAIGMTVETAADLVETDPQAARRLLSVLLEQTDLAVSEVRQLAHTQRPPVLDALGLVGALEAHLALLAPVRARLAVRGAVPEVLPAAVEIAAYRIVLEAVTNVTRHAAAATCLVTISVGPADLVLEVTDDGGGGVADGSEGFGLLSMRERAEGLGGRFHIRPRREGPGMVVTAMLPLAPAAEAPASPVRQMPS